MAALLSTERLDLSEHERALLRDALQSAHNRHKRHARTLAHSGLPQLANESRDDADDLQRIATRLGLGAL